MPRRSERLHTTRVVPYGMQHAARSLAESECLANGWDDASGTYVRAARAARARVESARAAASWYSRSRHDDYSSARTLGRDVWIDAEGYLCGRDAADAVSVPGMVECACELRRAVIALDAAESGEVV